MFSNFYWQLRKKPRKQRESRDSTGEDNSSSSNDDSHTDNGTDSDDSRTNCSLRPMIGSELHYSSDDIESPPPAVAVDRIDNGGAEHELSIDVNRSKIDDSEDK